MKQFPRHILAPVVLLCYLLGFLLAELTHHDASAILLQSNPVVESHDCGAHEIHLAWEDARHCVACSQFMQRLSTEVRIFVGTDASVLLLTMLKAHAEQTLETDILFSGKRGPPFA